MTQATLAEQAQADQTTISRLELGKIVGSPSHVLVQRICRALGVAWDTIHEFRLPEDKDRV